MRREYLVKFLFAVIACMITVTSCNKHDEPDMPDTENNNGFSIGNNGNNNGDTSQYYFRVETQVGNVSPIAGSMDISFDCNQTWSVSYSGNISGFSYTPSSGSGRGRVTIKYGEVNYRETASEATWDESGTLTFHIREGNSQSFRNTTYNVYISRRGSKKKV